MLVLRPELLILSGCGVTTACSREYHFFWLNIYVSYSIVRIRGVNDHLGLDFRWSLGGALSNRPVSLVKQK